MESHFKGKLPRLILRFRGKGSIPLQTAEAAIRQQGWRVVDQSSRMLLLEGPTDATVVNRLRDALPGWSVNEEKNYSLPTPVPRVETRIGS